METSKHGWGIAIDFNTGDPGGNKGKQYYTSGSKKGKPIYGTGVATTNEVKWLEENAGYYGFQAYYYDKKNKYFKETWHWDYIGTRK